jgi:hypothetical protein
MKLEFYFKNHSNSFKTLKPAKYSSISSSNPNPTHLHHTAKCFQTLSPSGQQRFIKESLLFISKIQTFCDLNFSSLRSSPAPVKLLVPLGCLQNFSFLSPDAREKFLH